MRRDYHNPGWGTVGRPTATGARRVQLSLSFVDRAKLERVKAAGGLPDLAAAFRACLDARPEPTARNRELAAGCRGLQGRGKSNGLGRWSQWLTRRDREVLRNVAEAFGFKFLSEAARLAVRAYQEG